MTILGCSNGYEKEEYERLQDELNRLKNDKQRDCWEDAKALHNENGWNEVEDGVSVLKPEFRYINGICYYLNEYIDSNNGGFLQGEIIDVYRNKTLAMSFRVEGVDDDPFPEYLDLIEEFKTLKKKIFSE